jgi:mannose-6-phosphate isomerase-like protein (cupin superfamily)
MLEIMSAGYDINLDEKYGQLTLIDITAEAAEHQPWFNQTLTHSNDAVIRLGVLEGEFHWHKHDHDDEFFLVLEGELVIEFEGGNGVENVTLQPHQGFTVPKGVRHKPSATGRTVIVMVEPAGVVPTGDE